MTMIYCRECGRKYSDRAAACPKCGYRPFNGAKNIWIYLVLTWFVGFLGIHKFYIGKNNQGIAMLLMGTIGWLLILPGLAVCIWALVDFIIGLCNIGTPERIFESK
ncbi:MAG: TM2 domain-containing protein [Alphaproteobacteria bacterium]|nr:TM2 domain-containing protein [Alphaproteobacteria bacterium]